MSFTLYLSNFCNEGAHLLLGIYFWYMAERFLSLLYTDFKSASLSFEVAGPRFTNKAP